METAFLKSFLLVAQTGSLAAAARHQNLTPAAISQQIKTLELELECDLVSRAGRTVQLTESGYRLLARAESLLEEIGNMKANVRADVAAGELRLGTINSALHTMVPSVLRNLAAARPLIRVYIQSGLSQQLVDAVKSNELDAAICLHPDYALPKSMMWRLLREEPLVVLAPRRLAKTNPIELLSTQPFIRYDRSLGGGRQADKYLRSHKIVPNERFELSSILAIAMMVHEGLGVSLVPDIGSPLTKELKITPLSLPDIEEPRRFGVIWQRNSPRSKLVSAFNEQLIKNA
jgi:DNA-binding transcriptional LysR family regulator